MTPPFTVLDTATMLSTEPEPIRWLIDGIVERGTLTLVAGREKEGKSLLCQALAACVASGGGDLAGFRCHPGRVLLVDSENGPRVLHRRVRGLGLSAEHAGQFMAAEAKDADLRRHLAQLGDLLDKQRPDLLVLDSFRSMWGGDENSSAEVSAVLDPLRNMVRELDIATLLIHHAGKNGSYRGTTAFGTSVENVWTMARDPEDPEPRRRRLRNPSCRYAQERADAWVCIEGDERRNLVLVEPADAPEGAGVEARRSPVREQLIGRALALLSDQPQSQGAIARRLDRSPKDQSVRRVLQALASSGEAERLPEGWVGVSRGVNDTPDTPCQVSTPPSAADTLTPPAETFGQNCPEVEPEGLAAPRCRCERSLPSPDGDGELHCNHCGLLADWAVA